MVGGGVAVASDLDLSYGPAGYKGLIKEPFIFSMAFFASIGGVLFGYDQGVISGVLVIQAAAVNIPIIFIGRFIAGLAIGQLSMVVPLYFGELAPPNIKGSLIALQQLGITVGIIVAFWLDYGTQHIGGTGDGQSPAAWRFPLALQYLQSIILAAGTLSCPIVLDG